MVIVMRRQFYQIFSCAFCFVLLSCAANQRRVTTIDNGNDNYFKKEISIDTVCIEKVNSLIKNKLDFTPNAHKSYSTNKYKRVIIYSLQPDSGKYVFDGPGAFIALNDTCGIDTIITEKKK
jgi:hypothetical protein